VLELRHEGWPPTPVGRSVQSALHSGRKAPSLLAAVLPPRSTFRDADTGRCVLHLCVRLWPAQISEFFPFGDSRFLATMALGKNHAQVWDLTNRRRLSKPLPHAGDYWACSPFVSVLTGVIFSQPTRMAGSLWDCKALSSPALPCI